MEDTLTKDHHFPCETIGPIGPHLKDGFSQKEETPANFKKLMEGDLRVSDFEMLNSLQSGTKLMRFPLETGTRNQEQKLSALKSLFSSLPALSTWEELIAPQYKNLPSEFKTH